MTTVRRALPGDARTIAHVHVDTWRAAYTGVMPRHVLDGLDVDRREDQWRRAAADEGALLLVSEDGGAVTGFASAGPCRDLDRVGELYALYVRPERWGTGAGAALLDAAEEWLLARWPEAVLWVAEENPRARRFYERHGWIAEERRVLELGPGVFVPEVRYRLSSLDGR